jgi:enoyl-CoA hydratase/carnithine racemase
VVEVLRFADAADLLEGFRRGSLDVQDRPSPLVIVDLDLDRLPDDPDCSLTLPANLPAVLVGVSRTGTTSPFATTAPDILLTEAPAAPAPWVSAPTDIRGELEDIQAAVSANPLAATTLMQVLRSSEGSPVEAALVLESLAYATLQAGPEHRAWLDSSRRPRPDDDPAPVVLLGREGDVLRLSLDRPGRRNAYSARMRDELIDGLMVAAADASVARVEVRGNGPNFCSGGDLAEFGSVRDVATAHHIRMVRSAGWWIHRLASRTEVYLHGACVGAGVELPAFAGRVVADPETAFTLPEVKMGLIPGAGGTASIPLRVGRQRTAWLALTGRAIDTTVALQWGLVDEVAWRDNRVPTVD